MITDPRSNRPKITERNITDGYVMRYFVKQISSKKVIEVDKNQYDVFKNNPFYQNLEMKWVIGGYDKDITSADGQMIYGAGHRNEVSLDFYEKKMSGLKRVIRNPLEYFNGTYVKIEQAPVIIGTINPYATNNIVSGGGGTGGGGEPPEPTVYGTLTIGAAFDIDNDFSFQIGAYDTPFTASIDWGDGNTELVPIDINGSVSSYHLYDNNNSRTITATIPDKTYSCSFAFNGRAYGLTRGYITSLSSLSEFTALQEITLVSSSIAGALTIPNTVTYIQLWGNSSIETLNLGVNPAASQINLADNPMLSTVSFTNLPNVQSLFNGFNCALSQATVDSILVALDNNGYSNGDVELYGGTSAAPSVTGLAASSSLAAKGWYVETN